MKIGRWYPSMLTLADGDLFVASGVEKLLKPVYPDRPFGSGTNVTETETYDVAAGPWTDNGAGGEALAAALPAAAPAARRPRLLRRRRPVVQPVRPVLRHGALEHRRRLRPRDEELDEPRHPGPQRRRAGRRPASTMLAAPDHRPRGRSASRARAGRDDPRLPRLDLLADDAAGAERRRALHEGAASSPPAACSATRSPARELRRHLRQPPDHDRHARRATRMTTKPTGDLSRAALVLDRRPAADRRGDRLQRLRPRRGRRARGRVPDPPGRAVRPRDADLAPDRPEPPAAHLPQHARRCCPTAGCSSAATRRSPRLYLSHIQIPGGFGPNDGRDPSFEIFKPPYLFRGPRPKIVDAPAKIRRGHTFDIEANVGARPARERHPDAQHGAHPPDRRRPAHDRAAGPREPRQHRSPWRRRRPPRSRPTGPTCCYLNRSDPDGPVPSKGHQLTLR